MPSQIQVQPKGIQSPGDAGTEDIILKSQLQFMADCRDKRLGEGDRKWKFSCPESLVLHYGRFWTPQPKPKDVRWGRQKQCFSNAHDLANCRPDLTYCEGFALDQSIPEAFCHAWCVDRNGNVVDNTWRTPGRAYMGIPLNLRWVSQVIFSLGTYGVLLEGDVFYNVKLLQRGIPARAIAGRFRR